MCMAWPGWPNALPIEDKIQGEGEGTNMKQQRILTVAKGNNEQLWKPSVALYLFIMDRLVLQKFKKKSA